jgi:uncharacterized membrane protein
MKKSLIIASIAAAVTLSSGASFAGTTMEKCSVVGKDGKGLIKAHKADCSDSGHSCAGQNSAGDAKAWIIVPKGDCAKINAGNFEGVSQEIQDKIEHPAHMKDTEHHAK